MRHLTPSFPAELRERMTVFPDEYALTPLAPIQDLSEIDRSDIHGGPEHRARCKSELDTLMQDQETPTAGATDSSRAVRLCLE
jgi:hypothetical protein